MLSLALTSGACMCACLCVQASPTLHAWLTVLFGFQRCRDLSVRLAFAACCNNRQDLPPDVSAPEHDAIDLFAFCRSISLLVSLGVALSVEVLGGTSQEKKFPRKVLFFRP